MVYEECFGPIPTGLCVLHRCDNKWCVAPEHLFLGTDYDNVCDMMAKRRHPHGAAKWCAKLDDAKVRSIRDILAAGRLTNTAIARRFGVSQPIVSRIRSRKLWAHVP